MLFFFDRLNLLFPDVFLLGKTRGLLSIHSSWIQTSGQRKKEAEKTSSVLNFLPRAIALRVSPCTVGNVGAVFVKCFGIHLYRFMSARFEFAYHHCIFRKCSGNVHFSSQCIESTRRLDVSQKALEGKHCYRFVCRLGLE